MTSAHLQERALTALIIPRGPWENNDNWDSHRSVRKGDPGASAHTLSRSHVYRKTILTKNNCMMMTGASSLTADTTNNMIDSGYIDSRHQASKLLHQEPCNDGLLAVLVCRFQRKLRIVDPNHTRYKRPYWVTSVVYGSRRHRRSARKIV